jgi:hypothetical protein
MFSNPLTSSATVALLGGLVNALIYIGTPVLVAYLLYSGFLFVSAQGNRDKITQAKETFVRGILYSVLLLGSWTFITLTEKTLAGLSATALLLILGVVYIYFLSKNR